MKKVLYLILFFPFLLNAQEDFWTQTKGPQGGHGITVPTLTVNNDGNIFAGTIEKGGFFTTGEGEDWSSLFFDPEVAFFSSIVAGPDGYMYACTDKGFFVSVNNGFDWVLLNDTLKAYSYSREIAIHPNGDIFLGTFQGVLRSTDKGQNWSETGDGFSYKKIDALMIAPNGYIFAGNNDLYRSTDNGNTWMEKSSGITPSSITTLTFDYQGKIFAGTHDGYIYRSSDYGDSWIPVNFNLPLNTINSIVANADSCILTATIGGVFRSSDLGKNWEEITDGLPHPGGLSMIIYNGKIFLGTNSGIFRSTNDGKKWEDINLGIGKSITNVLAVDSYNNLYAGTYSLGVFRSDNFGNAWFRKDNGLSTTDVFAISVNSNNDIFIGTAKGIFLSTDSGENWSQKDEGISFPPFTYILPLAVDANNNVFAGTSAGEVYKSTDNGEYWILKSDSLPADNQINAICTKPDGTIFAGTGPYGVFRSTDSGDTWFKVNNGIDNPAYGIRTYSIFAAPNGFIFAGIEGLFRSTDNGENWTKLNGIPVDINIVSIACNSLGEIFAGANKRVFRSGDNGDSWTEISTGLDAEYLYSLVVDREGFIFAGTENGVFRSINSTTSVDGTNKSLAEFSLSQNYPNPFNPSTIIKYKIPQPGLVTLKIYDILGKVVKTLVKDYKGTGTYEVKFDASDLSSGMYIYQFKSGEFISGKKMMLMK